LGRQIDRDEGAESGLHIGQKKDEPVEAAQALERRIGCRPRRQWRNSIVMARPPAVITVGSIDRMPGRAREQVIFSAVYRA